MCSSHFITGFRANVLEYQGPFTDDVAVQDFEVECDYGKEIVDALPIPVPGKGSSSDSPQQRPSTYNASIIKQRVNSIRR